MFQGNVENPGINQRALKHLFGVIQERKDMWSYTVTVCSVEIYNEVLRFSVFFSSTLMDSFKCCVFNTWLER